MNEQQALDLLKREEFARFGPDARPHLRDAAFLVHSSGSGANDASRLGGEPALPQSLDWPVRANGRPLSFLAQIALADVPRLRNLSLPDQGWLWFFYDERGDTEDGGPWGYDPDDRDGHRVLFWQGSADNLVTRSRPPQGNVPAFQPTSVRIEQGWSVPDLAEPQMQNLNSRLEASDGGSYAYFTDYSVFRDALAGSNVERPRHHLGGWPEIIQNPMQMECQYVTNGIYLGDSSGYDDPRTSALQEGIEDWVLLLQLDTDDEESGPGWMWGDCGMLYFWIRQQDLEARRFDRTWCILQCG